MGRDGCRSRTVPWLESFDWWQRQIFPGCPEKFQAAPGAKEEDSGSPSLQEVGNRQDLLPRFKGSQAKVAAAYPAFGPNQFSGVFEISHPAYLLAAMRQKVLFPASQRHGARGA